MSGDLEDGVDPVELPDWAAEARPIYQHRKVPLLLHYALVSLLLIASIFLLAVSVPSLNRLTSLADEIENADDLASGALSAVTTNALGLLGVFLAATVMGMAWVGCLAAQTGFCANLFKVILAFVYLIAIVGIITAIAVSRRAVSDEQFADVWGEFDDQTRCIIQEVFSCKGWQEPTDNPAECPGAPAKSNKLPGCSGQLDTSSSRNAAFAAAAIMFLDLICLALLLPSCHITKDDYFTLHAKRDTRAPIYRRD